MKLLWLDLNASYSHSSLALPALHAQYMKSGCHNVEWSVCSATIKTDVTSLAVQMAEAMPEVVAASCWLFNQEVLLKVLCRFKMLSPQSIIILGGPQFLGQNERFLQENSFVDVVFRGEAEEVFPLWLNVIDQPYKWDELPGFCFIDSDGLYCDGGIAKVLKFDCLAAPHESPFFPYDKPFVQLETTRGCVNGCTFCVSGGDRPVRSLSLPQVKERLVDLHDKGVKRVRFLDRTFNHRADQRELLALLSSFHPQMSFHIEVHPSWVDDRMLDELRKLPDGLLHLEAGIQSLQPEVLHACGRKGSLEKAMQGLRSLCELTNMETHVDLIGGLPLYTFRALKDDLKTLIRMSPDEIQLERLKLLPGTEMRENADQWGICFADDPSYEVLKTDHITAQELLRVDLLSRMTDDYYNTQPWQLVMQRAVECEGFYERFLDYLTEKNVLETRPHVERRGELLYQFCKELYPSLADLVSKQWIESGFSLKKLPAEKLQPYRFHQANPAEIITRGEYNTELKLYYLRTDNQVIWYGFQHESTDRSPLFIGCSSLTTSSVD